MPSIKEHIIETASTLFYKEGYNNTGINEIIKSAGIAKATLYHHFRSKDEICIAYLRYKNEHFLEELQSFCASKRRGSSRILGVFDFLEQFYNSESFEGCWCIKTVAELPKHEQHIRKEIQRQKQLFIDVLEKLVQENISTTPAKEKRIAKQMYLLYEGAVAEAHLHQDIWPIHATREMAQQLLK